MAQIARHASCGAPPRLGKYGKQTVNMAGIWLVTFVFLCGLTLAGIHGTILEMWSGRRLGFAAPFVSRDHVVRSLVFTAACGPLMLFNEALGAFRDRRVGGVGVAGVAILSGIWLFLSGIVVANIALGLRDLLS